MKRYRLVVVLIIISVGMILFSEKGIKKIKQYRNVDENIREESSLDGGSNSEQEQEIEKLDLSVVLDAGHGGVDPGKVGVNGALEKEINLSISMKLKTLLEEKGVQVVMTRVSDDELGAENAKNKKAADLNKRIEIIENTKPDITVSVHQNSFTQESSKGFQTFYYSGSEHGEQLAVVIQERVKEVLDDNNKREAKANDTYYLLRKSSCPTIIAECGFLSNYGEAELLITDEYQNKVAEALCEGILEYYAITKEGTR